MTPIRVAVIGYGLAGCVFHAPLVAAVEGLSLAAVVSSRRDEIARDHPGVPALTSAEEVFVDPDIDVVVVATPNDSHFDLAARALAAGKHVVIDKPFARTAAEARALIEKATGRLLTVYQNRRWDSDFLTLKSLIAAGELGEVVSFESRFDLYRPAVQDRWRERAGPATGTWYDLGSHLIDQALQLFGMPLAITADLQARRPGARTTDDFRALLRYPKRRVVLAGSCLAPSNLYRFVVHGTRSSFIRHGLDSQADALGKGVRPGDSVYGRDPDPGFLVLPGGKGRAVEPIRGDYAAFYRGVRDAIYGRAPLPVTASEALAVMDLLEAGEASSGERREIML